MCGVVAVVGPGAHAVDLGPAVARLHHRGPNGAGALALRLPWTDVQLGATRLSIVDLRPLPVPSVFARAGVALAYNGECYNWRALRAELRDVAWETQCDTEVIAHAWRRWGPDALDRVNGMFALVLVDLFDGRILMARDRAGEKPLFLARDDVGRLCAASEVKALPVTLVEDTDCAELDLFEYDCLERTPWRGVWRLGPGQRVVLAAPDDVRAPRVETWWRLPTAPPQLSDPDEARERLTQTLTDAIRVRLAPDAASAVLVSGGLDSAIIQAVARMPRVYCCTFPADGIDCMPAAQRAAAGAEVVPVTFGLEAAQRALSHVAYHLDTPGTWSALGHWFLAHAMAEDGMRVVLSGEGADELFAGYSRYRVVWWLAQARRDPHLRDYQAVVDLMVGGDDPDFLARLMDRSPAGRRRRHALELVERFAGDGDDLVTILARIEWHTSMQVLLRMADRMYAAVGIENRAPFLDVRVIELAAQIPTDMKVTLTASKAILRDVAAQLGVDRQIVDDTDKRGLVVPWNRWRQVQGARGAWDRCDFAAAMRAAWRDGFAAAFAPQALEEAS